jgi:hypothetical protein
MVFGRSISICGGVPIPGRPGPAGRSAELVPEMRPVAAPVGEAQGQRVVEPGVDGEQRIDLCGGAAPGQRVELAGADTQRLGHGADARCVG